MNKLLMSIVFVLMSVACVAQNTVTDADVYFRNGEYEKAMLIYVKNTSRNTHAAKKYNECIKCRDYMVLSKEKFREQAFLTASKYCDLILEINSVDPIAQKQKEDCVAEIKKLQELRAAELEKARVDMSEELLAAFKVKYQKQKEQVEMADKIIADIPCWKKAVDANKKEAYQEYLATTALNVYKNDAEYVIGKFECEETWVKIVDHRSLSEFEEFVAKYGKYDIHKNEAEARISLLKGVNAYSASDLYAAYGYFKAADESGNVPLLKRDKEMYRHSFEYYSFVKSTTESELEDFLKKFSHSEYCDAASSKLSRIKADQLTKHSSRSARRGVEKLAKDGVAKNYVYTVIARVNRERKIMERNVYGPRLRFGFNLDYEMNDKTNSWSGTVDAKYGRFTDWVNVNLGLRYRVHNAMDLEESLSTHSLGQQFAIPVELRFNLIPAGENFKVFIGCGAEFGFRTTKSDYMCIAEDGTVSEFNDYMLKKQTFSYYPKLGVTSRHFEASLYYKMYNGGLFETNPLIPNKITGSKNFYGVSLNCYF